MSDEIETLDLSRCMRFSLPLVFFGLGAGCVQPSPDFSFREEHRDILVRMSRIAVYDFVDAPGADAGFSGQVIAGVVCSKALQVKGWKLVERSQLRRVLEEHDLQASELLDPATAAQVGGLTGADGIIVGEVAQYRIGSIPFFFLFTLDQDVYKVDFTLRIISVEQGEVCVSAQISGQSTDSFEDAVSDATTQVFTQIDEICRSPAEHVPPSEGEFGIGEFTTDTRRTERERE